MLSIGLMSGTSMDGIDAALIETDASPNSIRALGHLFMAYDPLFTLLLKSAEKLLRAYEGDLEKAAPNYLKNIQTYLKVQLDLSPVACEAKIRELSNYLKEEISLEAVIRHSTDLHALLIKKLLKQLDYKAEQIDLIAYHGQTLFHRPEAGISIIIGDGQYLADQLGIAVINDFRSEDLEHGGQGAPLAPLYHQALAIRDNKIPLIVVNCGGISNISIIKNANENDLIAFDTGPGNALVDSFIRQRTHGLEQMDKDGAYGLKGKIHWDLIKLLYEKSIIKKGKNFFLMKPPKALDYGDMLLIPELEVLSLEDGAATLEAFTADSIVRSLDLVDLPEIEIPLTWVLCGGGWNNPMIVKLLEESLSKKFGNTARVFKADVFGWDSQAMEAQLFAYLGVRSLQKKAISFPGTTGVPYPLTGGRLHIPVKFKNSEFVIASERKKSSSLL